MRTAFILLLSLPCFAANRFWVGGGSTGNWNATANTNWAATSGGANNQTVPGTNDDVFFDGASGVGNATISASITIHSLTCTGYTGTITHGATGTFSISAGPFTLAAGMTWTANANSSIRVTATTGTTDFTTFGKSLGAFLVNGVGATVRFLDDFRSTGTGGFTTGASTTVNGNGFNVRARAFTFSGGTLTMSSGTWTVDLDWTAAAGATINAGTSTISMGASATQVFNGGSKTYNVLSLVASATNTITIADSSTFASIVFAAPRNATFTAGTTQVITGSVTCTGSVGNLITITSTSAGSAASLSKASGTVSCDYLSLKDSTATGGACWIAGANSTFVSGVTGWVQTGCATNVGPTSGSYILPGWQRIKQ